MWKDKDEDVRAQLLLSISGSVERPEYSCDIFMTFQYLAAHDDVRQLHGLGAYVH